VGNYPATVLGNPGNPFRVNFFEGSYPQQQLFFIGVLGASGDFQAHAKAVQIINQRRNPYILANEN
jgi:hypothetical protein